MSRALVALVVFALALLGCGLGCGPDCFSQCTVKCAGSPTHACEDACLAECDGGSGGSGGGAISPEPVDRARQASTGDSYCSPYPPDELSFGVSPSVAEVGAACLLLYGAHLGESWSPYLCLGSMHVVEWGCLPLLDAHGCTVPVQFPGSTETILAMCCPF